MRITPQLAAALGLAAPTTGSPGNGGAAGSGATQGGQAARTGYSGKSTYVSHSELNPTASPAQALGGALGIQTEDQLGRAIDLSSQYGNQDGQVSELEVQKFIHDCELGMQKNPDDKETELLFQLAKNLESGLKNMGGSGKPV